MVASDHNKSLCIWMRKTRWILKLTQIARTLNHHSSARPRHQCCRRILVLYSVPSEMLYPAARLETSLPTWTTGTGARQQMKQRQLCVSTAASELLVAVLAATHRCSSTATLFPKPTCSVSPSHTAPYCKCTFLIHSRMDSLIYGPSLSSTPTCRIVNAVGLSASLPWLGPCTGRITTERGIIEPH